MGVDITFFAEHRISKDSWSVVGDLVPNPSYFPDDPDFALEPQLIPNALDIPRCSALFAILANVNNGKTPVPYESIALPRGIPSDASLETKSWYKAWGDDAFAASWLTLSEIDSFDWSRVAQHFGSVDPRAAHLFNDNPLGFPFSEWPDGLQVSNSAWPTDIGNARWRATYAESAGHPWFRKMLTPFEQYDEVRFIFWFNH
jgi:hypothetical protein